MQVGETLGPYRIQGKLGEGGMGAVYKAHDTRLDRIVAIKRTTEEFRGGFEREARAIAALNHPHVCQLYDAGPDYLVMEFVDGAPLAPVDSNVSNPPGQGRAVFVRPFPSAPNAPDRRWQVSAGAGDLPVWSRNGQLFYGFYGAADPTAREIYEVPYRIDGDNFVADKPRRWSTATHRDLDLFRSFDASPNGERAVAAPPIESAALEQSRTRPALLLNFFAEVIRRIP